MIKKIVIIFFLLLLITACGYVLVKAYPDFKAPVLNEARPVEITLEFWGVWDNSDSWNEIVQKFSEKTLRINGQKIKVSVNYTKKDYSSYEQDLQYAKSDGNLPNMFVINNYWLERYAPDLSPLNLNKAVSKDYELLTFDELVDAFPVASINDFYFQEEVYAIPFYSDSLALFYNKDFFEDAGIKNSPASWKEFKEDVRKLTVMKRGEIIQAGVAMGTGKSVIRSSDILAVLMMQGGAKIIDDNKNVDINKTISVRTTEGMAERDPGLRAIVFYTEFSDPEKEVYSWDDKLDNSFSAFIDKKAAMMFGYSYQIGNLLANSPDLNYGIAGMPQLEGSTPINISNVWDPVVSKKGGCSKNPEDEEINIDCSLLAWSFLSFAAEKENSRIYFEKTGKAPARKDLIGEEINSNSKVSVFASQAETAISYNKFDDRIDAILSDMIDKINANRKNLAEIVDDSTKEIEALK